MLTHCHLQAIGAINAAVIAGHRDPDPAKELQNLWSDILSPAHPPFDWTAWFQLWQQFLPSTPLEDLKPLYANWFWTAFLTGQPNFFTSRVLNPLENPFVLEWEGKLGRDELAFYSTEPLRATLEKHVDFEQIGKNGGPRLSVGATRVDDGEIVFFDSSKMALKAEHVMASGALPPAFPPIEIERKWYFDGGVSSNTPIEALYSEILELGEDALVFIADLWDRKTDRMPQTWDELIWRQKSIQYGSRKKAVECVVRHHQDRLALGRCKFKKQLWICQVMRETSQHENQFCFSDADFLRGTYWKLEEQGYDDMKEALLHAEPVPALPTLYRYGSQHKHRATDKLISA